MHEFGHILGHNHDEGGVAVGGGPGLGYSDAEVRCGGKLLSLRRGGREAVVKLEQEFTISERRACRVIDRPRSCQRYVAQPRGDEDALVKRMLELVRQRPRFGYRRITALLRAASWRASATRIYPLWRRKGIEVPQKKRKRRRLGRGENGCQGPSAACGRRAGVGCQFVRKQEVCNIWETTK